MTQQDAFPVPCINDTMDVVSGTTYFSKSDSLKGFYQVPLRQHVREASAFVMTYGLFECMVMPFGMPNARSTSQQLAA